MTPRVARRRVRVDLTHPDVERGHIDVVRGREWPDGVGDPYVPRLASIEAITKKPAIGGEAVCVPQWTTDVERGFGDFTRAP